ncbi:MAG: hypothetical protein KF901_07450 [Myxococcales bacterium]|nr:hypothetical protein [Myxococcales bacterium]
MAPTDGGTGADAATMPPPSTTIVGVRFEVTRDGSTETLELSESILAGRGGAEPEGVFSCTTTPPAASAGIADFFLAEDSARSGELFRARLEQPLMTITLTPDVEAPATITLQRVGESNFTQFPAIATWNADRRSGVATATDEDLEVRWTCLTES